MAAIAVHRSRAEAGMGRFRHRDHSPRHCPRQRRRRCLRRSRTSMGRKLPLKMTTYYRTAASARSSPRRVLHCRVRTRSADIASTTSSHWSRSESAAQGHRCARRDVDRDHMGVGRSRKWNTMLRLFRCSPLVSSLIAANTKAMKDTHGLTAPGLAACCRLGQRTGSLCGFMVSVISWRLANARSRSLLRQLTTTLTLVEPCYRGNLRRSESVCTSRTIKAGGNARDVVPLENRAWHSDRRYLNPHPDTLIYAPGVTGSRSIRGRDDQHAA